MAAPSADDPRQWLRPMLKVWKTQQLHVIHGYTLTPDRFRHYDGWPRSSPMARIMKPGRQMFYVPSDQRVLSAFTGDGLLIRRAMDGMPYDPRLVLFANEISGIGIRDQCRVLEMSPSRYFHQLDLAYCWLSARMMELDPERTKNRVKESQRYDG